MSKQKKSVAEALSVINDGATIMVGGFGLAGQPTELIEGLIDREVGDLTVISNNAGNGYTGLAALLQKKRVRKIICSFPRQTDSYVFDALYRAGEIELELVPQGNLVARIEAAASGLGGIYTPVGYGTELAKGKEVKEIEGKNYVLELPLRADFALVKAYKADDYGNLVYNKTARNFGPIMAAAAAYSIVQVEQRVVGALDPEVIITPSIFVQAVVCTAQEPVNA